MTDVALAALDRTINMMAADPNCQLRPYQADAIMQVRDALARGVRRIMLSAPTGSGKTLLASTILSGFVAEERPGLVVVPRIELIDQTHGKFVAEDIIDIGIMQANHPLTNHLRSIQIASVQTLQRRLLPKADIVFLDEVHIWHDFYRKWMLELEWAKCSIHRIISNALEKRARRLLRRVDCRCWHRGINRRRISIRVQGFCAESS
jgi:superfamily II DNA or RNA helicase